MGIGLGFAKASKVFMAKHALTPGLISSACKIIKSVLGVSEARRGLLPFAWKIEDREIGGNSCRPKYASGGRACPSLALLPPFFLREGQGYRCRTS